MKNFLYDWKGKQIKKMDKDERVANLYSHMGAITDFYLKRSHNPKFRDQFNQILDIMITPMFAKTVKRMVKLKEEFPLHLSFANILATILERRFDKMDEDVQLIYQNAVEKLLKERAQKLVKKTGIDEAIATDILISVPEPDFVHDEKQIGRYVRNVLKRIYANADKDDIGLTDSKTIRDLMAVVFGKEALQNVAIAILLERKDTIKRFNQSQTEMWGKLTYFALDTLEKMKKKDIKELILSRYVSRRRFEDEKKNNDSARRINLASVSEEDYPKIHAVVEKLSKKSKVSQYL